MMQRLKNGCTKPFKIINKAWVRNWMRCFPDASGLSSDFCSKLGLLFIELNDDDAAEKWLQRAVRDNYNEQ